MTEVLNDYDQVQQVHEGLYGYNWDWGDGSEAILGGIEKLHTARLSADELISGGGDHELANFADFDIDIEPGYLYFVVSSLLVKHTADPVAILTGQFKFEIASGTPRPAVSNRWMLAQGQYSDLLEDQSCGGSYSPRHGFASPGTYTCYVVANLGVDTSGDITLAEDSEFTVFRLRSDVELPLEWLLRVDFDLMPDAAGPLASPLAGQVGELVLTQSDGQFSISSGELVVPAQTTPMWGDLSAAEITGYVRRAGLAMYDRQREVTAGIVLFGWDDALGPGTTGELAWYRTGANMTLWDGVSTIIRPTDTATHDQALITRNHGHYVFEDGKLMWVNHTGDNDPIYPVILGYGGEHRFERVRVADLGVNGYPELGEPHDLDLCSPGSGNGTSDLPTPINTNTFVHTPDFVLSYVVANSANSHTVKFRDAGGLNYWFVWWVPGTTSMRLRRPDGLGGWTTVISAVVALAGGETIRLIAVDNYYELWADDVLLGTFTDPTSIYVDKTAGGVSMTAGDLTNLQARTLDGVANVGSVNHPGYGMATAVLPGPRLAGGTFTHEADCRIEYVLDTVPSASVVGIAFRDATGTNHWQLNVAATGGASLLEYVAGSPTVRGSIGAGSLSGGERIIIECEDETIKVWYDNTLGIEYAGAVNFKTETSGRIVSLGTGGALSDLVTYPYNLAAAPNTPGAARINAAIVALGADQ